VRCDICELTVTCQVTYESHLKGKAHKKRALQYEKIQKDQEKRDKERMKHIEVTSRQVDAAIHGVPIKLVVPELAKPADQQHNIVESPEDFLRTEPNGDTTCTLCDARMNSKDCANAHVLGSRHAKNFSNYKRRFGGNFRGRGGGPLGRGGHTSRFGQVNKVNQPELKIALKQEVKLSLAEQGQAEYESVLANSKLMGMAVPAAEEKALAAMNAVLQGGVPTSGVSRPLEPFEAIKVKPTWPPPFVTVLVQPKGFKPGLYRCDVCEVNLSSEENLEAHLKSPGHKAKMEEAANPRDDLDANGKKIYRPRFAPGNIIKAQRGRRGLISGGEYMPDKLNKNERREQADIAKSIEKHLAKQQGDRKVLPLLMNFVRGETIKPEIFHVSKPDGSAV